MSLFTVALLVITALVVILWLMVRPTAEERQPFQEQEKRAIFGADDQASGFYPRAADDASHPVTSAAQEEPRVGERITARVEFR